MKIPINFHSAELHTQSLCMTITDSLAEAGADAGVTVEKLYQASAFAHELARFLDSLSAAAAGITPVVLDGDDEYHELRVALARGGSVTPIRPDPAAA